MTPAQRSLLSQAIDTMPNYPDYGRYVDDNNPEYRCPIGHLAITAGTPPTNKAIAEFHHNSAYWMKYYGLTYDQINPLVRLNDSAPLIDRKRVAQDFLRGLLNAS